MKICLQKSVSIQPNQHACSFAKILQGFGKVRGRPDPIEPSPRAAPRAAAENPLSQGDVCVCCRNFPMCFQLRNEINKLEFDELG